MPRVKKNQVQKIATKDTVQSNIILDSVSGNTENSEEISKPKEKGEFRFKRKKFFLTYPRCDVSKEDMLHFLEEFGEIEKFIIAREIHKEELKPGDYPTKYHLHCYLVYKKELTSRNPSYFDYTHPETMKVFHPNIDCPRSDYAVSRYCTKDGDWISNFFECDPFSVAIEHAKQSNVSEGINELIRKRPRDMLIYGSTIKSALESYAPKKSKLTIKYKPEDFDIYPEMKLWLETEFNNKDSDRKKCLFLCGKTLTGKSSWAKSIGNPSYFQGMFNLDEYDDNCTHIVFDDIKWDYIVNPKNWLTGQVDFNVTDKYKKKVFIKGGKPAIYIFNSEDEFDTYTRLSSDPYWKRNGIFCIVDRDLFLSKNEGRAAGIQAMNPLPPPWARSNESVEL